jgi:hypothetical protein
MQCVYMLNTTMISVIMLGVVMQNFDLLSFNMPVALLH